MGIEQHLVRLQRIRAHQECPTVRQLGVRNLQFDAFATNRGPVFAPVELERFTGLEHQRHKCAAPSRLLCTVSISPPRACKGCDTLIGAIVAKLDQVLMHQLYVAPLFARLPRLCQKPC
jgi:hypothetical protein